MKLYEWELYSAALARDAGEILRIFATHFPRLADVEADWELQYESGTPFLYITLHVPDAVYAYSCGSFRKLPAKIVRYMQLDDGPFRIIVNLPA